MRKPFWKILTGDEAVSRAAGVLTDASDRLSSIVRAEEAIALIPALRKALEEGRAAALHVVYDNPLDLSPFLALGLPVLVSASSQEAADLGVLALVAARSASTPVIHAYDRRWVGEELSKLDVLSEDELRKLDQTTPRGGKENFSEKLSAVFKRFEALTGRALRFCEYSGPAESERVCAAAGVEAENLRDEKTGVVTIKLVRPLPSRAFLEALPSTTKEILASDLLRTDVLSALHEGIVGGWSWFVALPPILPLPAVRAGEKTDSWKAVLRARGAEALSETEAAVRGFLEDLSGKSNAFFQCHTMTEADGGSLHLRVSDRPIRERRPIENADLVLSWQGDVLSVAPAGSPEKFIDLDAVGRETGLGKRVAPVIASCLLASMDTEERLGLARERSEEILSEAVEDRWGDFSQDIVAAHRKAMERTRRILADSETVIPLRPLEKSAARETSSSDRPFLRADLKTHYLGFQLPSPLIACVKADASEAERRALAESPAGAVFFGPVVEEDLDREAWRTFETLHQGVRSPGYQARPPLEKYAEFLKGWKESVEVPVIAGLSAVSEKNWLALAFALEQAGADALEIVLYSPEEGGPPDPLRIVSLVAGAVRIPVAVRLTPNLSGLLDRPEELSRAGAKAIALFQPPAGYLLHPEDLEERRENLLSGPQAFRLALPRLTKLLNHAAAAGFDIAASGPISDSGDLLSALLAGSDAVYVTSEPGTPSRLETSLKEWMGLKGFPTLAGVRSVVSHGEAKRSVVD